MKLEDFSYFLPDDLIAQHPRPQRDASRMMMLHRRENTIEDLQFSSLPDCLQKGDVLVINDSRVIPARIYGKKSTGAILEILLITCKEKKCSRKDAEYCYEKFLYYFILYCIHSNLSKMLLLFLSALFIFHFTKMQVRSMLFT